MNRLNMKAVQKALGWTCEWLELQRLKWNRTEWHVTDTLIHLPKTTNRTVSITLIYKFRVLRVALTWTFRASSVKFSLSYLARSFYTLSNGKIEKRSRTFFAFWLNMIWQKVGSKKSKTAGYRRHIFRFPSLLETPFERPKAFFLKKIFVFILFSNFSKLESFKFFNKKI